MPLGDELKWFFKEGGGCIFERKAPFATTLFKNGECIWAYFQGWADFRRLQYMFMTSVHLTTSLIPRLSLLTRAWECGYLATKCYYVYVVLWDLRAHAVMSDP